MSFFKKNRAASGKIGGVKGKGKKGGGALLEGSSFMTFKESAPSTSTKLPKGARSKK